VLRQPFDVRRRRRETLQHEADSDLAAPETPFAVLVWKIRFVDRALEVRHPVAFRAESVQRRDSARAAEVERVGLDRRPLVGVQRMDDPAVVERALRIRHDRGDRRPRSLRVPRSLRELLVGGR